MTNDRFILRYRGAGSIPNKDLAKIKACKNVEVLDETSRMLLVEVPKDEVQQCVPSDKEWIVIPEKTISLPDPTPKVKKKG